MTESGKDIEIELSVQGMTGVGGEPKVVSTLEELPGVKNAYANYPQKRAVVTYDQASVTTERMCRALLKAGYVASPAIDNKGAITVSPEESRNRTDHRISDFICYCFEYTKQDIEKDFLKNGRSIIMEKITAEKKTGGCDCTNKNPKGRGCLPDVRRVVDEAMG